jgi:ABC-type ATPase with predicted acetyltransferase domain
MSVTREHLSVSRSFEWTAEHSGRVNELMGIFGIDKRLLQHRQVHRSCDVTIEPGTVVYITGPSGAGKSVLLNGLYHACGQEKIRLCDIELDEQRAVIDCVGDDVADAMSILTLAGLGEVFSVLNTPAVLSEGQRYRYRLACAIYRDSAVVFGDEFCSNLDRITACSVAFNLRRAANRSQRAFVLAGCRDDIIRDLQPDITVAVRLCGETEIIERPVHKSPAGKLCRQGV